MPFESDKVYGARCSGIRHAAGHEIMRYALTGVCRDIAINPDGPGTCYVPHHNALVRHRRLPEGGFSVTESYGVSQEAIDRAVLVALAGVVCEAGLSIRAPLPCKLLSEGRHPDIDYVHEVLRDVGACAGGAKRSLWPAVAGWAM